VLFTPEDILIQYPLEVYSRPVEDGNGKVVGEHMVLRPYLVMTQDTEVVIDTYNVLCSSKLDGRLVNSYEEMVDKVYKKSIQFEGDFYQEEPEKEMTKEEAEYLNEVLENFLEKEKTLH
jgi:hypothetical protein